MEFVHDDGGRKAAGYKGIAGDCVVRAIAIATQIPYQKVYDDLFELCKIEKPSKVRGGKSHPRNGVHRVTYEKYLTSLGWKWVPCMTIGTGCKVHLRAEELPSGRIVVRLSNHLAAVIDGVLHDIYESARGGTRCVYGYFINEASRE